MLGTGLTLFLFLPAAFVDVDTLQLEVHSSIIIKYPVNVFIIKLRWWEHGLSSECSVPVCGTILCLVPLPGSPVLHCLLFYFRFTSLHLQVGNVLVMLSAGLLLILISVTDVSQDSGVGGEAGLRAGDIVLAIQGRKIRDMSAYRSE